MTTEHNENRSKQASLVRLIGNRMRTARIELHNMTLNRASKQLGYANASKLSRIENAVDSMSVPLMTILNAARLYEVPIDYLFGETDDWDWRPSDGFSSGVNQLMYDMMENSLKRQMDILRQLEGRQQAFVVACEAIVHAANDLEKSYSRLITLNPEFESEMKGGATLKARIDQVVGAAKLADMAKHRFQTECKLARNPDSAQAELDM